MLYVEGGRNGDLTNSLRSNFRSID